VGQQFGAHDPVISQRNQSPGAFLPIVASPQPSCCACQLVSLLLPPLHNNL
jgi:hypothetical protein